MRIAVAVAAAFLLTAGTAHAQSFEYFGELGPSHWGVLAPQWSTCGTGAAQSPVTFTHPVSAPRYSRLPVEYGDTHGFIFNNGHTIEVETEGHNILELGGEEYELVQFHFHTPSEHRQNGRGYEMELHLVHRSPAGKLAVVGVLLSRGATSGSLTPIFDALPDDVGFRHELPSSFNPAEFLPVRQAHARYGGSLTTPPCTEGVSWFVLEDGLFVSDEHLARFTRLIPFNARPVQRRLR